MGAKRVKPLKVLQNTDKTWVVGFANQDPSGNLALATAVSFAGMTAKMQVRQGQLTSSTLFLTLATGGSGIVLGSTTYTVGVNVIPFGTITITVTNSQTSGLPAGSFWYDCIVYNGSLQECWLQGVFEVGWAVTR